MAPLSGRINSTWAWSVRAAWATSRPSGAMQASISQTSEMTRSWIRGATPMIAASRSVEERRSTMQPAANAAR